VNFNHVRCDSIDVYVNFNHLRCDSIVECEPFKVLTI
jgi:hypothetical protein